MPDDTATLTTKPNLSCEKRRVRSDITAVHYACFPLDEPLDCAGKIFAEAAAWKRGEISSEALMAGVLVHLTHTSLFGERAEDA
jgi:hypothetical protein